MKGAWAEADSQSPSATEQRRTSDAACCSAQKSLCLVIPHCGPAAGPHMDQPAASASPQVGPSRGPREKNGSWYIALSIGYRCELYRQLKAIFPDFDEIVVNVKEIIDAPPRGQRKHGWFPTREVIASVESSAGFKHAVEKCKAMLCITGIVVVACNGGHHRAPTVASHLECDYVVHCVIQNFSIDDIAGIIYTCHGNRPESLGPGMNWLRRTACKQRVEAYVGWAWYGFENDDKWTDPNSAPYLERGDVVIVEAVHNSYYVSVMRLHDSLSVEMTFAWLLPRTVRHS